MHPQSPKLLEDIRDAAAFIGEVAKGTHVVVVSRDMEGEVHLSVEELAELEAGIAEADRGETISGEALYDRLRRFG